MNKLMEKNPKVFISYCQQCKEFSDVVLNFSNILIEEGIDVTLDQYIQSPPEGWPRWMENSIQEADFVLMICTEEYYNRVMGKTKSSVGRGVKWEGNLIYQKLYDGDSINCKFIPIIFDESDIKNIPLPIKGSTYYNVNNKDQYDALYWRLRKINPKEKPKLGKLRPLPKKERKSLFVASLIDIKAWDKAIWKGAAYLIDPTNKHMPCFMLPFYNEKYARKIFEDWIIQLGKIDEHEELRVSIIEGDVPGEDKGYYIHISSNWETMLKKFKQNGIDLMKHDFLSVSRIHRANPQDNFKMYNLFKKQYYTHNSYLLMPCILDEVTGKIKPLAELSIQKTEIVFKNISDIGENDPDQVVLPQYKSKS